MTLESSIKKEKAITFVVEIHHMAIFYSVLDSLIIEQVGFCVLTTHFVPI